MIGKIAGLFCFLGFIPYFIETLHGKTKPSISSWSIWTLIGFGILGSYYVLGARETAWVAMSNAICPLGILFIALWKYRGEPQPWRKDEVACFIFGIALFIIWITGVGIEFCLLPLDVPVDWLSRISLYGSIIIDACGAIPTIVKSWRDPESESLLAWTLWTIGNILNIAAIFAAAEVTVDQIVYPVYMAIPSILILPALVSWKMVKLVRR